MISFFYGCKYKTGFLCKQIYIDKSVGIFICNVHRKPETGNNRIFRTFFFFSNKSIENYKHFSLKPKYSKSKNKNCLAFFFFLEIILWNKIQTFKKQVDIITIIFV